MINGKGTAMTDRLLKQMIKWDIIRSEDEEIYRYGLEGLILKLMHYTSYLIIAVLFREMLAFLFFFFAFLLLRKNAGGYHAKTRVHCYIFSCATVLCVLTIMKTIPEWGSTTILTAGLILLSDLIICITAPMENENRPLDEEEKNCFRKRCLGVLAVENIFFWLLNTLGKDTFALAIALAVICEAILLLLGKIRKGNNEIETKQGQDIADI